MRLSRVERGQGLKYRMMFGVMRVATGGRAPDVLRVLSYRPDYFGEQFSRALNKAIRGDCFFTVGERELLAACTSKINDCHF